MSRPPPKEKKKSFIPKTKLQQSNLKSDGKITGWFKLAPAPQTKERQSGAQIVVMFTVYVFYLGASVSSSN